MSDNLDHLGFSQLVDFLDDGGNSLESARLRSLIEVIRSLCLFLLSSAVSNMLTISAFPGHCMFYITQLT
jgi:hypothetical protein